MMTLRLLATLVILGALVGEAAADDVLQPQPTLAPGRAGRYTLKVVTVAPSACYRAGPVRRGPPPHVRLTADTVAVRVVLTARRGPCAQVLTPVHHTLRNLKLGGPGKARVTVFAMVDGKMVGSSSVEVKPTTPPAAPVSTSDWRAWRNVMPGGPPSLHVSGVIQAPSPGYEATLVLASPQGINPAHLILDLRVTAKPGTWPQVITPITARFDQPDDGRLQTVTVREPDGDTVPLPIETAH